MASKDRSKSPNPPSPASSSPTLGKSSSSKKSNQKSVKLDVPTSFTIDVNQIASARKQLKNVGKAPTGDNDSGPLSSITVESPEKQGLLKIMASGAWDTKWCQLKEARLYIYPNQKAPIPESILSLNGSRVGDKKQHGVEYCFQITTQHGEILIFSADDDYEYITWIVALRGATLYLKISSFVVVESPATATATSPRDNNNSNNNHNNNNNNKPSPLGSSSPSISPSVSPSVPRVETTSASPSLVKKGTVTSKSPNFALPPSSETKAFRNSTGDISKLPARLHAIDFNTPSTTPSTTPSSTLTPSSTSTSTPHTATGPSALLSPISAVGGADKFSSYRRSADVSKLSKDNYAPLSDAISAAYRKSVDVSKLSHSADVSKLSHSAHVLSPTATSSPHNLFSSVEIIPSEKELMEAKGGRRGLLGVPGGMFTKWKQRWVVLANDSLAVYKHEEDEDKKEPVHSFELIFCQPKVVKSEKGKYVFEIHAPGRTIQFGAPSSVDLLDWIHSIQETQTTLMQSYLQYNLGGNSKPGESEDGEDQLDLELEKSKKKLSNIMQSNGNNVCVDCGAADPIWASINWGVFICIECSGVHRQMGTHISKVRSVTMDKWDTEVLEFMENHGNAKVNSELEQNIPPNFTKITPTSSRHEREAYIKAKYEEKLFSKK